MTNLLYNVSFYCVYSIFTQLLCFPCLEYFIKKYWVLNNVDGIIFGGQYSLVVSYPSLLNQLFSCRSETARCFVSLNLSVSHSISLKVIRSRSIKTVPFESLGTVSYSHSVINYAVSRIVSETRMVWLPDDENRMAIRLAVSTENRRVTDRQTDKHLKTPKFAL